MEDQQEKDLGILILEDTNSDALLIEHELRNAQIRSVFRRVDTKEDFLTELKTSPPDLILADYALPCFDGISALALAQEQCPNTPFIFVSGSIGEEIAIESLKRGATDYVYKHRLARLVPAVRRALRETAERTERQRAEAQLQHYAFHDRLSGLPNRALLLDRIGRAIEIAKRYHDYLFAALFLDLDRFKVINDSLGHLAGDQLLLAITNRLKSCLRYGDTLARLGGDEFAIFFEDLNDISDVTRAAEQIQQELRSAFNLSGQTVFISASIGIALNATGNEKPEDLLRNAETAMYRAKAAGKACYQIFDRNMHARAVALLQLETDLRRAIAEKEFQVYYQPIVSLASGQIESVEALLRWHHPKHGIVNPADFIPLAEETGLITPIGEWVLQTVCEQQRAWRTQGLRPINVAVNISACQFHAQDLPQLLTQTLTSADLPPQSLQLEITETTAMKDIDFSIATLQKLSETGLGVAIDDFGTGYSSLAYLKRFPINVLKIDRSFIQGINTNADDAMITAAIIGLAHNLKLKVVAEGVETIEQLAFLRAQQCDKVQGYLFSRPVPALTLTEMLDDKQSRDAAKPVFAIAEGA